MFTVCGSASFRVCVYGYTIYRMNDQPRTEGEQLFERYLNFMQYSYEFEKTYSGRNRKPDYTINAAQVFLADVKDFDTFRPPLGFQQVDVHFRIREKIQAGYKKFKEYKDFPCAALTACQSRVCGFT